ncbi:MAG: hemolysin III family protein [Tetrasphaera sp.]
MNATLAGSASMTLADSSLPPLKPKLRGWLHASAAPLVLAAGIVLICLADNAVERIASAIYAAAGFVLFATSATYHRFNWSPRPLGVLKRWDHANIYLLIAGSYTPIVAVGLSGTARTALLWTVWVGALLGVAFRVFWVQAPRILYTLLYVVLGWSVVPVMGRVFSEAGVAVGVLTLVGGVCYTVGGILYGLKRPNPWPRWFGFHEIFHAFTIAAWTCQYVAIALLVY